jgi:hypothetical protein
MTTLGRREKCLRNRCEKGHLRALRAHQVRNLSLPGAAGNTVDQNRAKTSRARLFGLYASWNRRVKTEIPVEGVTSHGEKETVRDDCYTPSN